MVISEVYCSIIVCVLFISNESKAAFCSEGKSKLIGLLFLFRFELVIFKRKFCILSTTTVITNLQHVHGSKNDINTQLKKYTQHLKTSFHLEEIVGFSNFSAPPNVRFYIQANNIPKFFQKILYFPHHSLSPPLLCDWK